MPVIENMCEHNEISIKTETLYIDMIDLHIMYLADEEEKKPTTIATSKKKCVCENAIENVKMIK